jgi:hypothetical protein
MFICLYVERSGVDCKPGNLGLIANPRKVTLELFLMPYYTSKVMAMMKRVAAVPER